MSKRTQAPASPADAIANLIARRDTLREQHAVVRAAPRAFEEALADVPRAIEALAARAAVPVGYLTKRAAGAGELAHALSRPATAEHAETLAGPLLAWLAPELLAAAIERDLAAVYAQLPEAMATDAKATELAKLDRQIAATEAEVASTWWAAIDGGMSLAVPEVSGAVLIGLSPQ